MYFVKSCHSSDNVHLRKTIKIGTLNEYRNTEQQQIVDAHEGTFHFEIDLERIHIQTDIFNLMHHTYNSFVTMHNHDLIIRCDSHALLDAKYIERHKATIKMVNHNRFVFCMSRVNKYTDARGMFPEYDDLWYFPQSRADLFAKEIGNQLNAKILSLEKEGNRVFEGDYDISKVSASMAIQTINYKDRMIKVDNEYFYKNTPIILQTMNGVSFIKPSKFSHEKEVRFIFDYHFEGRTLSPDLKSIIIPMREGSLHLIK